MRPEANPEFNDAIVHLSMITRCESDQLAAAIWLFASGTYRCCDWLAGMSMTDSEWQMGGAASLQDARRGAAVTAIHSKASEVQDVMRSGRGDVAELAGRSARSLALDLVVARIHAMDGTAGWPWDEFRTATEPAGAEKHSTPTMWAVVKAIAGHPGVGHWGMDLLQTPLVSPDGFVVGVTTLNDVRRLTELMAMAAVELNFPRADTPAVVADIEAMLKPLADRMFERFEADTRRLAQTAGVPPGGPATSAPSGVTPVA